MNNVISNNEISKIESFYQYVAKMYQHTYTYSNMHKRECSLVFVLVFI